MSEDWTSRLTEAERGLWVKTEPPWTRRRAGRREVLRILRSLAASRALVAAKDEALQIIGDERDKLVPGDPVWVLDPVFDIVAAALALTEKEMMR